MKITVSLIERNERRDGHLIVNGYDVKVENANLAGSEKQVAWAEKIIADAALEIAQVRFSKLGDRPAIAQAEAELATINAFFAQHMSKLTGSKAADWIDLRDTGPAAFSAMLKKAA